MAFVLILTIILLLEIYVSSFQVILLKRESDLIPPLMEESLLLRMANKAVCLSSAIFPKIQLHLLLLPHPYYYCSLLPPQKLLCSFRPSFICDHLFMKYFLPLSPPLWRHPSVQVFSLYEAFSGDFSKQSIVLYNSMYLLSSTITVLTVVC